jgi:coproporphyrinogen III oxidase
LYPKYKAWCDDYFYLPSRREHRGTGGIFFDDLDLATARALTTEVDEPVFDPRAFTEDVGRGIIPSWEEIARCRADLKFSDEQREWQELRRGRYIEFNLLYDRGVRFGLEGGRIESIMVSAPPRVQWQYLKSVDRSSDSPEGEMLAVLRTPRSWA